MTAPVTVTVELRLNGAWTNVTSYVRLDPGIDITIGQTSENATADASTATLVFNNTDGRFTPRNTAGAYYPYLKRNTPLRITVGTTQRFLGEVPEWPPRWIENENAAWTPVTASGMLRRLQHAKSLDPTLVTAIRGLAKSNGDITGYWPVEDAAGSTSVASALSGGQAGGITGRPVFAAVDLSVGTGLVATWGGSTCTFFPTIATSTAFTGGCYMQLPATGLLTGGEELFRVECNGTANSWRVLYSPGSGGGVFVQVLDQTGTEVLASSSISGLDGLTFYLKLECSNSGANVAWALSTLDAGSTVSGTLASQSIGSPTAAKIGKGIIAIPAAADVAIGHVVLGTTSTALFHNQFDNGRSAYAGETVEARLSRLATENSISIDTTSGPVSPTEMGAQPDGSLLDVLRAAEKADAGGVLRDSMGVSTDNAPLLAYITRWGRYNDQRALLSLDYSLKHVVPPLEPIDDDQTLRNQITANREGGSSARAELTTGALSSAAYPTGVGPYPFEDTYAIYSDSQLPYLASWLLRLGTLDETRWPAISIDLVANPTKVGNVEAIRPGWRVQIANLPALAGATTINVQVVGWREHLSSHERTVTLVCTPGSVWEVFKLDSSTYGRLDSNYLAY